MTFIVWLFQDFIFLAKVSWWRVLEFEKQGLSEKLIIFLILFLLASRKSSSIINNNSSSKDYRSLPLKLIWPWKSRISISKGKRTREISCQNSHSKTCVAHKQTLKGVLVFAAENRGSRVSIASNCLSITSNSSPFQKITNLRHESHSHAQSSSIEFVLQSRS